MVSEILSSRWRLLVARVLGAALATFALPAMSQEIYPGKRLTMLIPYGAGSSTDGNRVGDDCGRAPLVGGSRRGGPRRPTIQASGAH